MTPNKNHKKISSLQKKYSNMNGAVEFLALQTLPALFDVFYTFFNFSLDF